MSPEEVADIAQVLAYCAAVDPRFTTSDEEQGRARVATWCDVLDGVPAEFVLSFVRRYYRGTHQWPVEPGPIRQAWLTQQARTAPRQLPVGRPAEDVPPSIRAELTAARQRLREATVTWGWD